MNSSRQLLLLCGSVRLVVALHVDLCQVLDLFRQHPRHFRSSLQLPYRRLTFPPSDRRSQQDWMLLVCPTHSTTCHHTTVSLPRRRLDYSHLWCLWWGFQTSLAVKKPCLVLVSNCLHFLSMVQMFKLSCIYQIKLSAGFGLIDCHSRRRTFMSLQRSVQSWIKVYLNQRVLSLANYIWSRLVAVHFRIRILLADDLAILTNSRWTCFTTTRLNC